MTKLGDVVDMTFGNAFKSAEFSSDDGDIRLLRGDNVAQGRLRWEGAKKFPASRVSEVEGYRLQAGDVVIAMDRPWIAAGLKYAVVRESDLPCLLVQRVARVRAKQGLDQGYLGAIVGSKAFTDYVIGVQTGSAVPHISGGQIANFELPSLPPIEEQRGIAATLGALDDKIESNRRATGMLQDLVRLQFERAVAESEAEIVPLSEIATVTKGRSYKSVELQDSSTALVTLKSISRQGGYKHDGLKPYVGDYKPEQVLRPGELVVAQTDLTQGAEVVGRGVRIPPVRHYETLVASLDLAIVRPRHSMPLEYLYGLLTSESFRQHCRSHVTGTTVLHLAKDAMPTWPAPVIPPGNQEAFARIASALLARMDALDHEADALLRLRAALLPELLSDRIRVPEAAAVVQDG